MFGPNSTFDLFIKHLTKSINIRATRVRYFILSGAGTVHKRLTVRAQDTKNDFFNLFIYLHHRWSVVFKQVENIRDGLF